MRTNTLKNFVLAITGAIMAVLVSLTFLYGQAGGTAKIYGSVADSSGAIIPGATVVARNKETGVQQTTLSTTSGDYVVSNLPVGTYMLTIKKQGFKAYTRSGIELEVDQAALVNATLEVGTLTQHVVVTGNVNQLITKSSTLMNVVGEKRITDLPLNGRNVLQLTALVPGVLETTGAGGLNQLYTFPDQNFVGPSGGRGNTTAYILDGMDNTDLYTNVANAFPDPDAVREFSFQTNNFSAKYGDRSGGVVNVVTRSGTNEFHGTAFEFVRTATLNATNFFTPGKNDGLVRNQFGGTLGGPIVKNRAFFFGSYQGTVVHHSPFTLRTVPTLQERNGDFSDLTAAGKPVVVSDPKTGVPFTNNIIPTSDFSPVTVQLLPWIPLPNAPNGIARFQIPEFEHDNQVLGRVDYTATRRDRVTLRYFYNTLGWVRPPSVGKNIFALGLPASFISHNVILSDTHTFSPSFIGIFDFGLDRLESSLISTYPFKWTDLGVHMTNLEPGNDLALNVGGFFNVPGTPLARHVDNVFQWNAEFTKEAGKHELDFGANIEKYQFNNPSTAFESYGHFYFGNRLSGSNLTDFFLGTPSFFTQITPWAEALRATRPGLYVEDSYRLTNRFTLNLGLRWEPLLPWIDVRNNEIAKFVPGQQSQVAPGLPAGLLVVGDPGVPRGGYNSSYDKFDPRFGFAWNLGHRTVMRGGFGVFRDFMNAIVNNRTAVSDPYVVAVNVQNPTSFENPFTAATPNPFPVTLPPPASYIFPRPVSAVTYGNNITNPYSMQWNYTLEHQVSSNWLVRASYIASRGVHLMVVQEDNPAIYIPGASSASNVLQRRIYGPAFTTLQSLNTTGTSDYQAMAISVDKRFSRGLSLDASYTLSKSTDEQSAIVGQGTQALTDPYNRNYDHALSNYDATHRFVASFVWQLPTVSRSNSFLKYSLGGWQFNGIVSYRSGNPFTVFDGFNRALNGVGGDRPNLVGSPSLNADRPTNQLLSEYFNTSAFQLNAPGSFGTAGRNIVFGPGYSDTDFSLFKGFSIRERVHVQLRAEFFNLFNQVNFGDPVTGMTSASFGKILSAGPPRILQGAIHFSF